MEDLTKKYKEEIDAWLNNPDRDFDAGFELFARFSHNRALALQMARMRKLSKLEYELQKIADRSFLRESRVWPIAPIVKAASRNQEHTEAENQIEKTGKKLVVIDERINYDELPEPMKKLYDENRETYKLMRAVHEKMKLAAKDQERAELRAELVGMDDAIANNWEKLDKWANGEEEEVGSQQPEAGSDELKIADDPNVIAKELNACRSFISRNAKKVATLDAAKQDTLLKKLAERVATLKKYNAEIKEETRLELVKLGLLDENT